jgi:hypothetical protein
MLELIDDEGDNEVLVYTDDAGTAALLRESFRMHGAVYGKEQGYHWKVDRNKAKKVVRLLGLQFSLIRSVENKGLTATQNPEFAPGRVQIPNMTQCATSDTRCA